MRFLVALSLWSLAGLSPLEAQDLPGAKRPGSGKPSVKVAAIRPEKAEVAPGETVKVAFDLEIPKGWHIYAAGKKPLFGQPTKFSFDNAELGGPIEEPPLKIVNEPGIGDLDYHEGNITVTVPLNLKAGGPGTVTGKIAYQICNPSVCVDNDTPFSFTVTVKAAPGGTAPGPVKEKFLSITSDKTEVKAGETFVVTVELEIPEDWHIYPTTPTSTGLPTELKLTGAEPAGAASGPPTKTHPAEGVEPAYEYYDGKVTLKYPMKLKEGAAGPTAGLSGKLSYQICNATFCILRKPAISLNGKLPEVDALPSAAKKPEVDAIPPAASGPPKELQKGLLSFLVIAVLGGLASLLQPCVFPLMPVTITYFIKQADGSRAKSVFLSVAYAVGLIISFTTIGIVFSLALGADGARIFATKWYVNVIVALLFLWFGFSLFGFYDISLPSWLVGGLTNKRRQGAGGSFILGMLFSVVTFTCTVPIAGLILAASASSDSHTRFMGIVGMLVYSSVMAIPFIVMGVFPSLVTTMRKSSGDWLETTKVTMGFVELPVALFYLSKADTVAGIGILTRWVMITIWVAALGVTILYLLRVFQRKSPEAAPGSRRIGIPRILIVLVAVAALATFASGYDGRPLGWLDGVLPPNTANETPGYEASLAEARKSGKPVFLEFTGVTCTNCQVMKGTVLASPAVKALMAQFVFAELYTDRQNDAKHAAGDEENRKLLVEKFQGYALPFYMTLGPDGVERSRILGKVSEAEFIEFLKKGLQASPAGK